MTFELGRRLAAQARAGLVWLAHTLTRLVQGRTLQTAFAVLSLTVRLSLLLAPPIAAILVVLGFIGSAQGREAVSLAFESVAGKVGLALSLCLFVMVTAESCHFVLVAYQRRLEKRLSLISASAARTVTPILRDWLGRCLCLVALLSVLFQEVRPGWLGWAAIAVTVTVTFVLLRYLPARGQLRLRQSRKLAPLALAMVIGAGTAVSVLDVPTIREPIYTWGPLPIALIGLAFWCAVGAVLLVGLPIRYGLPSLLLLPLVLAAWWSARADYNEISVAKPMVTWGNDCDRAAMADFPSAERANRRKLEVCNPLPMLDSYFHDWLVSMPLEDEQDYIPVFLVAAEGGGIRAAYWTESILNRLDEKTEGRFSRHVFAISGVSGGSVGMLAYYDRLKHRAEGRTLATGAGQKVFREDLLSPLVFGLLFPDAVRNVVGGSLSPSRAELFESAVAQSWERATGSGSFHEKFADSFVAPGGKGLPVLIANATVAESGQRFLISNVALHPDHFPSTYIAFDPSAPYDLSHLSAAQVAHLSARFPFVSPAASIRTPPSDTALLYSEERFLGTKEAQLWGHIVDGGYFENSGATTLLDLYRTLQRAIDDGFASVGKDSRALSADDKKREFLSRAKRVRFYVLSIRNDPLDFHAQQPTHPREPPEPYMLHVLSSARNLLPGEAEPPRSRAYRDFDSFAELFTPPRAMLSTREARGSASRVALQWAVNGTIDANRDCRAANSGLQGNIQCHMYGGSWLEANLAKAIFDDMDKFKCVMTVTDRPALGWALERESADLMDCVLKQDNSIGDLQHRVSLIMAARSRLSMDHAAYQVMEGWRRERSCDISAGKEHIDKTLTVPQEREPRPDDSCRSHPRTPFTNYVSKPVTAMPCEEAAGRGKAWMDVTLMTSAMLGDTANLACLLKKGADANAGDAIGNTPLLYALQNRQPATAWLLLRAGARADVRSQERITPLLASVEWAEPSLVQELVNRGADVEQPARTGITPVMIAASKCRKESFDLLLLKKPNLAATDERGWTAADWAKAAGCPSIQATLAAATTGSSFRK